MITEAVALDDLERLSKDQVTLIYFTAPWCGPCKRFGPIMEAFEAQEKVPVLRVNVDNVPEISTSFSVKSIPTVISTIRGVEIQRRVGVQSPETLKAMINFGPPK